MQLEMRCYGNRLLRILVRTLLKRYSKITKTARLSLAPQPHSHMELSTNGQAHWCLTTKKLKKASSPFIIQYAISWVRNHIRNRRALIFIKLPHFLCSFNQTCHSFSHSFRVPDMKLSLFLSLAAVVLALPKAQSEVESAALIVRGPMPQRNNGGGKRGDRG